MAMLYTPASTALVQPQLKFGKREYRVLQGNVSTSFANEAYIESNCKTPITPTVDPKTDEITRTCIQLEHASESFHNYFRWIGDWTDYKYSGEGSRYLDQRLSGWALFDNSIEMTAPWIEIADQGRWRDTDWFVNNVTMAMPHPGVVMASQDPANEITQPEDLNGLGVYSVRATVPVPFINVICLMGLSANDLKPLVYTEWDTAENLNIGTWPIQLSAVDSYFNDPYLGGTSFDDVFEWGEKWGPTNFPPIFPKLPINYNTIANDTLGMAWGRKAVYLLLKGGYVDVTGQSAVHNYGLCELRVGQTPECSTRYNASSSVGTLEALCEDPHDDLRYIKSLKNASSSSASLSADWPDIGSMWLRSMQLNNGLIDGNASNARLLTELLLTNNSVDWSDPATPMALDPAFPSPAEALAVSAGCTLIQSALGGPFVEFWNYSITMILEEPQIQYFNASIIAQQYASGGLPGYQQGFGLVLFVVFIINIIVLSYFLLHRDWYIDFSDPTNLFALAINSPPSEKLADCTCGGNYNERAKFRQHWKLENTGGHISIESPDFNEMKESPNLVRRASEVVESITSPVAEAAGRMKRPSRGYERTHSWHDNDRPRL